MHKISIKTSEEIALMSEGGRLLAEIRDTATKAIKPGITTIEIDTIADRMIKESGGKASFKLVPGYKHATCININDVVVHGIPGKEVVKEGDVVGLDVGLYYEGFHTDTSTTVHASSDMRNINSHIQKFLETGKSALKKAIEQARPGKRVDDLSRAMQETVEAAGYSAVRALTGHGIGRELHEDPYIPCFVMNEHHFSPELKPGMVVAIEVMYNEGTYDVEYKNNDGWTIGTADGKISGLFEETVAIQSAAPLVLTKHK